MIVVIGAPVVYPLNTPARISTTSPSFLCVETSDWPGLLKSSIFCISFSFNSSPAGQPSSTAPTHLPWLSPKLVKTKLRPIELPANNIILFKINITLRFFWQVISYQSRKILQPILFISEMKSGYEISTDSGSDIVQLPTYIPAMQNAMNNL